MDPQVPTLDLTHAPADPPAPPEMPKKDNHWITIMAMALFVLGSLAVVVFLYYQNQQLKTMLAGYQTKPSPSPSATADPTANWRTYTNTKYNYSIKFPQNWSAVTPLGNSLVDANPETTQINIREVQPSDQQSGVISIDVTKEDPASNFANQTKTSISLNGIQATKYEKGDSKNTTSYVVKNSNGFFIELLTQYQTGDVIKEIIDRIISTFKLFVSSPTPSSSPLPSSPPPLY